MPVPTGPRAQATTNVPAHYGTWPHASQARTQGLHGAFSALLWGGHVVSEGVCGGGFSLRGKAEQLFLTSPFAEPKHRGDSTAGSGAPPWTTEA